MDKYLDALIIEIQSYRQNPPVLIDSVFIGGGTPTLLGEKRFERLISCIKDVFTLAQDVEFSVEMNPATADKELLLSLKRSGVNRISLGIQSFCDAELLMLGRAHNAQQATEAVELIKDAGFTNFNLDLMYAIPGQTEMSFMSSLKSALAFDPPHLSLYSLILEEGTTFWKQQESLDFPSEDEEMGMYDAATALLKSFGYDHYEISNYAKNDKLCRHNLKYWTLAPYIGCGTAAHSYFNGMRFSNGRNLAQYIVDPCSLKIIEHPFNPLNKAEEYVMLGLRTSRGISFSKYMEMFGKSLEIEKQVFLKKCLKEGYIAIDGDNLRLTEKGFYLSTAIIGEILA